MEKLGEIVSIQEELSSPLSVDLRVSEVGLALVPKL